MLQTEGQTLISSEFVENCINIQLSIKFYSSAIYPYSIMIHQTPYHHNHEHKRIEGVKRSEGIVCLLRATHPRQATLRTQSAYRSFASFRGGVADDRSRLGVCSIIEPSLHHPFALQCDLDVPTVSPYDHALPLTIPSSVKAAFAFMTSTPASYACRTSVPAGLTTETKKEEPHLVGRLCGSSDSGIST